MTFKDFTQEVGKLLQPVKFAVRKNAKIASSEFMKEAEKVHKNEKEWNRYFFGTPSVWKSYDNFYQIDLFQTPTGKR